MKRAVLGAATAAVMAVSAGMFGLEHAAAPPPVTIDGGLVVRSDANGSCYVAGRINGSLFPRMLLDTGASGYILLGKNAAARAGIDPAQISYSDRYDSANGIGREARVQLKEFRLNNWTMRDVPAEITKAPQSAPLIGIKILRPLAFRLTGRNCVLSWKS